MKKLLCMLLAVMMVLGGVSAFAEDASYKIAILTGTTTQGEEELRAAQREQAADPEHIITDTYPDSFLSLIHIFRCPR